MKNCLYKDTLLHEMYYDIIDMNFYRSKFLNCLEIVIAQKFYSGNKEQIRYKHFYLIKVEILVVALNLVDVFIFIKVD